MSTWRARSHRAARVALALLGLTLATAGPRAAGSASQAAAARAPKPSSLANASPDIASAPDPRWQSIVLQRHGASGGDIATTFGIPFPPGRLRDARTLHILDEQGAAVPSSISPSLYWHSRDGSIRAVRVQLRTRLQGDRRTLHFVLGRVDPGDRIAPWPYAQDLVTADSGVRVPGVLAVLSAPWMAASLVAGPQQPSLTPTPYDQYVATQFEWARKLPATVGSSWLFDRPSTLYQAYVRTGREDYLAAAIESYRFYMAHVRRVGPPGSPLCGGGWTLGEVNACDPKYVYVEPILLALALSGDDIDHDSTLIARMIGAWDTGGWNFPAGPYLNAEQRFTEREAGLGLLATVSAYEITGDPAYLDRIALRIGWLYDHQRHNPDGLGDDGSWRNSWQKHEGDSYDPATDVRGSSPWMSENIIDGLWHAWLVTADQRIPAMITGFGRYMERVGWIDPKILANRQTDWRNTCSGPNGQISWYWSSAHADNKQLIDIQNSEGWYSDAHNVEMTLPIAAARYFETDPAMRRALDRRLSLLASSLHPACAANSQTPRRFNWNNRGVGVTPWLMRHTNGGTPPTLLPAH